MSLSPIILGNTGSLDHTTHIIFAVNPEAPSICSKRFAFQRMIFRPSVPFDSASTCDRLHHEQENAIKLNKGNLGIFFLSQDVPIIPQNHSQIKYGPYIFLSWFLLIFLVSSGLERFQLGIFPCQKTRRPSSLFVCLSHHSSVCCCFYRAYLGLPLVGKTSC